MTMMQQGESDAKEIISDKVKGKDEWKNVIDIMNARINKSAK
jgi:hypothetical protein